MSDTNKMQAEEHEATDQPTDKKEDESGMG